MKIDNKFNIGETVYISNDTMQLPRMITRINVNPYDITYEIASGTEVSAHYDFELSSDKVFSND